MPDVFNKEQRSHIMAKVLGKNTSPERAVRKLLFELGYRYRVHQKNLPGKPDIVFPKKRKAIFVHGCFWHQHPGCKAADRPSSNSDYWDKKLNRNVERDKKNLSDLRLINWDIIIIWECQVKRKEDLTRTLVGFLGAPKTAVKRRA
jgi:DNA mismatch endonuclease (patch repair protein)